MKIRWTRDGVRFRISPSELAALQSGQSVHEELAVGTGRWSASITPGATDTRLEMQSGELCLRLGEGDLEQLSQPDAEGVYFGDDGTAVRFYVEKDFPCVHPRAAEALEPQSETFRAPTGFAERKA